MREPLLKAYATRQRNGTTTKIYSASLDEITAKCQRLSDFMMELAEGPGEAMVLLDQLLLFYKDKFGVVAIETTENPPQ